MLKFMGPVLLFQGDRVSESVFYAGNKKMRKDDPRAKLKDSTVLM